MELHQALSCDAAQGFSMSVKGLSEDDDATGTGNGERAGTEYLYPSGKQLDAPGEMPFLIAIFIALGKLMPPRVKTATSCHWNSVASISR